MAVSAALLSVSVNCGPPTEEVLRELSPAMSDQELQQSARRQLYSELSYVLGIEEKDVFAYIMSVDR